MKFIFSFLILLFSVSIYSQSDSEFVIVSEFGLSTVVTDSTWNVHCVHPNSQLGKGYLPTQIVVGNQIFDQFGRMYKVKTVVYTDFGTSDLIIVELQDQNLAPSGVGVIYEKHPDHNRVPLNVGGSFGVSEATKALLHNHNVLNGGAGVIKAIDVTIEDAGGLITATNVENAFSEAFSNQNVLDLRSFNTNQALGVPDFATDMGTYTGGILTDNTTGKANIQEVADAIDNINTDDADADPANEIQDAVDVPYDNIASGLTATNQQAATDEILALIPGNAVSQNYYVSNSGGDDATGVAGNPFKPWDDIRSAVDVAGGNLVSAYANDYTINSLGTGDQTFTVADANSQSIAPFGGDHKIFFEAGSKLLLGDNSYIGNARFISDNDGLTATNLSIIGKPEIIMTGGGDVVNFKNNLSNLSLEADLIQHNAGSLSTYSGAAFRMTANINMDIKEFRHGVTHGFLIYGNTSDFNISAKFDRMVAIRDVGNTNGSASSGRAMVWFYGTNVNNTTMENVKLNLKIGFCDMDSIANTLALSPSLQAHQFIYLGNKAGRNLRNAKVVIDIDNYRRTYNNVSNEGRVDADFYMGRSGQTIFDSDFYIKLNNGVTNANLFVNLEAKLDNTTMLFDLGIIHSDHTLLKLRSYSNLKNNSNITFKCAYCTVSEDVAINYEAGNIEDESKLIIEGTFRVDNPGSSVISLNGDPIWLKNCALITEDDATPAIIASTPTNVYIMGSVYSNAAITTDPDVNLIYLNSAPDWDSEIFTASAAQTVHTVSSAKLPSESANLVIIVDGLEKTEGAGEYYTYVASTGVITFSTAFVGSEKVKLRWYD